MLIRNKKKKSDPYSSDKQPEKIPFIVSNLM